MQQTYLVIEIDQQLKNKVKKIFALAFNYAKSFLFIARQNQQLINELEQIRVNRYPQYSTIKSFIRAIVFDDYLISCKICGKYFSKRKNKKSKNLYCSLTCMHKDVELHKQIHETTYKNHTKEQLSVHAKLIWQKKLADPIEKKKFIESIQKSVQRKYGVKNIFQHPDVKKKIKQTLNEKYGVDYAMQSTELKQKFKQSIKENNSFSNSFKQKFKTSMNEKYGVDYALQNKDILQKVEQTNLTKYGFKSYGLSISWNRILANQKYVIPLFSKNEFCGLNHVYKWKCAKCGYEFLSDIHTTFIHGIPDERLPRCVKCYPYIGGTSALEKQVIQFCKQFYPNLEIHNRKLLKNLELDIVIPELKLAIQFNGCYWHSLNAGTLLGYHLNKTNLCEKLGYRLIHIWEDEWLDNRIDIQQKLKLIFSKQEIIDYSKILDRCWYPVKQLQGYKLNILLPEIINRHGYECENCGYLQYLKLI